MIAAVCLAKLRFKKTILWWLQAINTPYANQFSQLPPLPPSSTTTLAAVALQDHWARTLAIGKTFGPRQVGLGPAARAKQRKEARPVVDTGRCKLSDMPFHGRNGKHFVCLCSLLRDYRCLWGVCVSLCVCVCVYVCVCTVCVCVSVHVCVF